MDPQTSRSLRLHEGLLVNEVNLQKLRGCARLVELKFLSETREGEILVRVGFCAPVGNPAQQLAVAGIAAHVGKDDLGMCKTADNIFHARLRAVGDRRSQQKFHLPGVTGYERFKGSQQELMHGGVMLSAV